ncbi:acetyltransferase [Nitratireductor aquimarinus]|uniref:GNAT family N-acetyltransferase n=1 Tax=Alphaproteobacteria TaxID=28211 RepID=UPI0019D3A05D|nr:MULTISPECIES: GNAT family N-acetyltransferase [Alphaproteobacteria]MBN7757566.1 acetyltransferase [Nitratireductor aquimarinus]MBY6000326.1 hypothetical protein [Tritonibacter mobilis]MBY6022357.1 acetyltransferase [Nitratireductor sp. DP7N14-4]
MQLILAKKTDKPLIDRMLREYLEELSPHGGVDDDYPYLDLYWQETDRRWPYLFRDSETVTGFAFVRALEEDGVTFSMAEFAVLSNARRRGLGRSMAVSTMHRHPGTWEVSIMAGNQAAQIFWPKAIIAAGAENIEKSSDTDETIYRFSIAPAVS